MEQSWKRPCCDNTWESLSSADILVVVSGLSVAARHSATVEIEDAIMVERSNAELGGDLSDFPNR